jgi:hypothetical protein
LDALAECVVCVEMRAADRAAFPADWAGSKGDMITVLTCNLDVVGIMQATARAVPPVATALAAGPAAWATVRAPTVVS